MRTLAGALAVALAIGVGLYLWQESDPAFTAPFSFAPERSSKPRNSAIPSTRAEAQRSVSLQSNAERKAAQEATNESAIENASADTLAPPAPKVYPVITSDLPSYLSFYVTQPHPSPPDGCKSPFELLVEMTEQPRDEVWASRVERALRALLGPHPLGFHVSITCRAAICQVTSLGPSSQILEKQTEYNAYWGEFMEKLRNDPFAPDFVTAQFFAAPYAEDPSQDIAGYVFTSRGHPAATKTNCANFTPTSQD